MKLIRKLETKKDGNGNTRRFGLFQCPVCLANIVREELLGFMACIRPLMKRYFKNLYKALIGKPSSEDLLDFISTFEDKFSSGILHYNSTGFGSIYNASNSGIYAKKEVKFKTIKELERLIKKSK